MRQSAFIRIYEDLYQQISRGTLLPGMPLPSENTLSQQYKASRPTVRKAVKMLSEKSLVLRQQGIGSVVAEPCRSQKQLTFAVDLRLPSSGFYFELLLHGIQEAVDAEGHKLLLACEYKFDRIGKEIAGLILTNTKNDAGVFDGYARIAHAGTPVILINRFPANPELAYISVDYRREMFRVTNRLLKNGAWKIGLYAPLSFQASQFTPRLDGWREAFAAHQLPVPEDRIVRDESPESMARFIQHLKNREIDVLFVSQGQEFFAAMSAVVSAGLSVGKDLSVICFDDLERMSEKMNIPVSMIKMPLEKMGRMAVEHLIKRVQDPAVKPLRVILEASLVVNQCPYLL